MNHPGAWTYTTNTVGGHTYTQAEAIALMKAPSAGDMSLAMFQGVMAAQLNVAMGVGLSCPWDALTACQHFLATHPAGTGVAASSGAWQNVADDYATLVSWWDDLD